MIVACCTDLIFSTKIRSTAEHIGVPFRAVASTQALADRLNRVNDGKLNEPVTGVIIDLELGDAALAMIELVKSQLPGIHVVAFGSHVAVEILQAAKQRGADAVMPRSQFSEKLPELLKKHGGAEL